MVCFMPCKRDGNLLLCPFHLISGLIGRTCIKTGIGTNSYCAGTDPDDTVFGADAENAG